MDVNDGKTRVMNNLKLYTTLLGKFKSKEMMADLVAAKDNNDNVKVAQVAHAIRGTAGNLGFPILHDVTSDIETLAKQGDDVSHLMDALAKAVDDLDAAIAAFTAASV